LFCTCVMVFILGVICFSLFFILLFFFFFFFSSRRRHTRCLSDWSSDVCSSDLDTRGERRCLVAARIVERDVHVAELGRLRRRVRSEERRVGKEWRCRWWPDH